MSVEPQQTFDYTAVNGSIVCQNCRRDGETYKYHNGQTHAKVVLCHDCWQIARLRGEQLSPIQRERGER